MRAGKRAAGDQSVAARQEALSRQEAVVRQERDESLARQEQAQRETESQLREKETRIQVCVSCSHSFLDVNIPVYPSIPLG
jgi:hypothetical protein